MTGQALTIFLALMAIIIGLIAIGLSIHTGIILRKIKKIREREEA